VTRPSSSAALPLDEGGVSQVLESLDIRAPELWAVLTVETRGCGFLADRRPAILFERHVFSRLTGGRFDSSRPDVSNPVAGGYGAGGAAQYGRLEAALELDAVAALMSASWGIAQIMGENHRLAGFSSVEAMVESMRAGENEQLLALARFLEASGLEKPLRGHDWTAFARGYNGPAYAKNNYDTRLAGAHARFAMGQLPDLTVRAAQVYLFFLGYEPGPVDGLMGRLTRSAMNDFQEREGLSTTDEVTEETLAALAQRARG
jgi:hypothetical protein